MVGALHSVNTGGLVVGVGASPGPTGVVGDSEGVGEVGFGPGLSPGPSAGPGPGVTELEGEGPGVSTGDCSPESPPHATAPKVTEDVKTNVRTVCFMMFMPTPR